MMMPGYGDAATFPVGVVWPDAEPEEVDEVHEAKSLIAELRKEIDRAEKAVFSHEWETYRLAILNAHDLAGSLFQ